MHETIAETRTNSVPTFCPTPCIHESIPPAPHRSSRCCMRHRWFKSHHLGDSPVVVESERQRKQRGRHLLVTRGRVRFATSEKIDRSINIFLSSLLLDEVSSLHFTATELAARHDAKQRPTLLIKAASASHRHRPQRI